MQRNPSHILQLGVQHALKHAACTLQNSISPRTSSNAGWIQGQAQRPGLVEQVPLARDIVHPHELGLDLRVGLAIERAQPPLDG